MCSSVVMAIRTGSKTGIRQRAGGQRIRLVRYTLATRATSTTGTGSRYAEALAFASGEYQAVVLNRWPRFPGEVTPFVNGES